MDAPACVAEGPNAYPNVYLDSGKRFKAQDIHLRAPFNFAF